MYLTEYNETETMELLWQEGLQKGEQNTMLLNISNLMKSTGFHAEKAMDLLIIPQNQRTALYMELSKNV